MSTGVPALMVRRVVRDLVGAGAITVHQEPGKAIVLGLPLDGALAVTRAQHTDRATANYVRTREHLGDQSRWLAQVRQRGERSPVSHYWVEMPFSAFAALVGELAELQRLMETR